MPSVHSSPHLTENLLTTGKAGTGEELAIKHPRLLHLFTYLLLRLIHRPVHQELPNGMAMKKQGHTEFICGIYSEELTGTGEAGCVPALEKGRTAPSDDAWTAMRVT